jgi:SAM-dependent methyltransferase
VAVTGGTLKQLRRRLKADLWKRQGRIPGGYGANAAKWIAIDKAMHESSDGRYGWDDAGLDERVVEYAWLFDRLRTLDARQRRILDAGSVLNHRPVLAAWRQLQRSPVSIVTLGYEGYADVSDRVRYEFGDLRELPYRDGWFDITISLSTVEHIGLDNRIYGAAAGAVEAASNPGLEAQRAVRELHRVTADNGTLLLSVPYGARSNRGWFRILDQEDLAQLTRIPGWTPTSTRIFRAFRDGWREVSAPDAADAGYNEPAGRPGQQTAPPFVAAAEAVALVEMRRD